MCTNEGQVAATTAGSSLSKDRAHTEATCATSSVFSTRRTRTHPTATCTHLRECEFLLPTCTRPGGVLAERVWRVTQRMLRVQRVWAIQRRGSVSRKTHKDVQLCVHAQNAQEQGQADSSVQALVDFNAALSWEDLKAMHASLLSQMVGSGEETTTRFPCGAFAQLDTDSCYDALNETVIGSVAATAFNGSLTVAFQVGDLFVRCLAEELLAQAGADISNADAYEPCVPIKRAFSSLHSLPPGARAVQERATATVATAVLESLREEFDMQLALLIESSGVDQRVLGEADIMVRTIDSLLQYIPQPDAKELEHVSVTDEAA